jgi:hypothetical protein
MAPTPWSSDPTLLWWMLPAVGGAAAAYTALLWRMLQVWEARAPTAAAPAGAWEPDRRILQAARHHERQRLRRAACPATHDAARVRCAIHGTRSSSGSSAPHSLRPLHWPSAEVHAATEPRLAPHAAPS